MGVPDQLKNDNGPAYTRKSFENFCANFHIIHKTGIPYNPQGQAIVERANLTVNYPEKKNKKGGSLPFCMLDCPLFFIL